MTAKTTTARAELEQLVHEIEQADKTLQETRAEAAEATRDPGLAIAEGAAWAKGDHAAAEKIAKQRHALVEARASWQARLDGASRAFDAAKRDRQSYVAAHGDDLIAEHAVEAKAATAAMLDAAADLRERVSQFTTIEGKLRGYTPVDRHRRDDPRLTEVVAACERLLDPNFAPPYSIAPLGRPCALPKPTGHPGGPRPQAGNFAPVAPTAA
ncbi:MAG: hypothetical protein H0T69_02430 [Thermoleophilaceae bacterium]|nr:hypothetical protein [Thermoleophilaceae bacterium]